MTIRDRAKGLWGTVGTWFNFARGPCLWLALVTMLAGGLAGGWLVRGFMDGKVARAQLAATKAEKNLSDFTGQLARNAADTERLVGETIAAAERRIAARDAAIAADVAAIPSRVARQLQPELQAFRSAINANPVLADCLDQPLPAGALSVLERPARSVPAPDR